MNQNEFNLRLRREKEARVRRLKRLMKRENLDKRQLAEREGVSYERIRQLLKCD